MKARERTYVAIIIALAIHAIVLFVLNQTPHKQLFDVSTYAEIDLMPALDEMAEPQETHTLEELMEQRIEEQVANLVADANSQRTDDRQSYVSKAARDRMAASVEGDLKELERQTFEQAAERRKQVAASKPPVEGDQGDESAKTDARGREDYEYFGKSYNGNVTAEYDLPGREARLIHIPGYKCKGGGVVHVKIVVNPNGEVIEAEIDPARSSFQGDCLPTEALVSAKKSVFFIKSGSPKRMSGSITYRFIPQ
jgi:hypothetical protein